MCYEIQHAESTWVISKSIDGPMGEIENSVPKFDQGTRLVCAWSKGMLESNMKGQAGTDRILLCTIIPEIVPALPVLL